MKKIISMAMVIIMALSFVSTAFAVGENETAQLQFNEDGKFKILILADIQDSYPLDPSLIAFMEEALDKTNPDLVVFLGDNIMRPADFEEESYWLGFDQAFAPLVERGVPFTFVFGNHDDESMPDIPKEVKFAKYLTYNGCLAYEADPALHGCGTHNLEILSSDGSRTAFNLWLMDCGDYEEGRTGKESYYDYVRKDQIEWYEATSKALEEKNGAKVPSFLFQHIIPAEVGKQVMVTFPFRLGDVLGHFQMDDGSTITYLPNVFGFYSGTFGEGVSPARNTDGQWASMVERGDVLAAFFGHDHTNTFQAMVDGIDAVNVPSCTYHAYYSDIFQGAMLLTVDENEPENYKKDMIYSSDLALEEGSALPGLTRSLRDYKSAKVKRSIYLAFVEPILKISGFMAKLFSEGLGIKCK